MTSQILFFWRSKILLCLFPARAVTTLPEFLPQKGPLVATVAHGSTHQGSASCQMLSPAFQLALRRMLSVGDG